MPEDQLQILVPNFAEISKKVFVTRDNKIFIGGEEISAQLRGLLKDEATYIENSRLWELLNDTIIQESARLALMDSEDFEHVQIAKMLFHWSHVFRNMMFALKK
jgi:hypothetical protein